MTAPADPAPAQDRHVTQILFPRPLYASMLSHVVRKLTGHHLPGETDERKAFGMVTGRPRGTSIEVTAVYPLLVNARHEARRAVDMDEIVDAHAIPSETPNAQRGWIAHPRELLAVEHSCDEHDWLMFGNYHTHRVAWPHDPRRDTCTALDRALAQDTGQWVFIVSAVDLHRLCVRAFYEGDNNQEAIVRLIPEPRRESL
jgi:hypothetical protein